MRNKIISREYYAIDVSLVSPLNISNGEDYYSDADVLTNGSGEYFIPGTSLAGAFRNYLGKDKKTECAYGFADGDAGRMSSIFISDIYLEEASVSVRDRVKLTELKNVDNKFDVQIIGAGARGKLFLECVKRENDEYDFGRIVSDLLYAISIGEIRIGADKNRGFGVLKIGRIASRLFTSENLNEWESFLPLAHAAEGYPKGKKYSEWSKKIEKPEPRYVRIHIPLELKGGISIRQYSAQKNSPDYVHITENGIPIIPGTSWNGALRSDALKILRMLGCRDASDKMDQWFGFVRERKAKDKPQACQSMIVVGESKLEKSRGLTITRNKIDRFSAATVSTALYTEYSYFGGFTDLDIKIKKDVSKAYEAAVGLMILVLKDLQGGYISVGGQGAIGRGIFALRDGESWTLSENQEQNSSDKYLKALYELVRNGGKEN